MSVLAVFENLIFIVVYEMPFSLQAVKVEKQPSPRANSANNYYMQLTTCCLISVLCTVVQTLE